MEIIMKKMLFVFNPNSGKAQIKNSLLKIIQHWTDLRELKLMKDDMMLLYAVAAMVLLMRLSVL